MRRTEDGALAGVRYMEVQARACSGEARITSNVWKMARRYGEDYWLYIVTDAGTDSPELQRIQNPAAPFRLEEDIFVAGFRVPEDNWR